ncbi:hypothetical protein CPB85DRAFT_1561485 [Mucidula mucida]|nr:hypothetical protein CPB85DRAFT_1561485 [Mucidula mucida]
MTGSFASADGKNQADALAKQISEATGYRFTYHSRHDHKNTNVTRFSYNCAQLCTRQHAPKKHAPTGKHHDKDRMDSFECHGWVTMWVCAGSQILFVRFNHALNHVPYFCIDVPDDVRTYVKNNPRLRPNQLWTEILKDYAKPQFSYRLIYYLWARQHQSEWKRDEDELKSTRILIDEYSCEAPGQSYHIQNVPMPEKADNGFTAVAFVTPNVIRKWGGKVCKIAMDSAWNTNGARYELYAILGEVYRSGCPLGYLLIQSNNGEAGQKEKYLRALLEHFNKTWEFRPIQSLTDKDIVEINTFIAALPAKHQLCFWHCLRAIKVRLATTGRHPAHYNVEEAFREFDWIDRSFVPINQVADPASIDLSVAQQALPSITFRIGGKIVSKAPEPLKLRIPIIQPSPAASSPNASPSTSEATSETGGQNQQLENFIDGIADLENPDDWDQEDGPDWLFEPGESVFANNKGYCFCPPPHRSRLLHIFAKHFCEHPALPGRDSELRTALQIRNDAVHEMYQFCHQRGLREVWGYMWTLWYSPEKWKLWARSTTPYLCRLRTTMTVENFWRHLKHGPLQHLHNPRLDQLVWVLITDIGPRIEAKMERWDDDFRAGRSRELTPLQKAFKAEWKKLAEAKINGSYETNIEQWTCSCGRQKYSPYLLCKHLVQAVEVPGPRFFQEVVRRRVAPFYRHPLLIAKGEAPFPDLDESQKSIRNGDDRPITGTAMAASLTARGYGKRKHSELDGPHDERHRQVARPVQGTADEPIVISGSSSPIHMSDAEDDEYEAARERVRKRAEELELAAKIMREQCELDSKIWVKSIDREKRGNDISLMLKDIRAFAPSTGATGPAKRRKTWATPGDKDSQRFTANTMGYQAPLPQVSRE